MALAAVQLFIGIGGVYGGVSLVSDPSGGALGMPQALLVGSPFVDYLVPGVVLLLTNGVGTLSGAGLALWGHRWAAPVGVVLGSFLMLWIVAQVAWMGLIFFLQPMLFVFGMAETGLGLGLQRRLRRSG